MRAGSGADVFEVVVGILRLHSGLMQTSLPQLQPIGEAHTKQFILSTFLLSEGVLCRVGRGLPETPAMLPDKTHHLDMCDFLLLIVKTIQHKSVQDCLETSASIKN